jgi:hypothetical protein
MAQNNTSYWLVYLLSTGALVNVIITKYVAGEEIDSVNDFIFAKIGGKNPDGTPRRVTNMSYIREVPMWMKHVEEEGGGIRGAATGTWTMFMNKSAMAGPISEMLSNRDYYGYQLYDPSSNWWLAQLAGSELKSQFSPITLSGASHAADLSGTWWDKSVPMSFLGFGPAPAYANRTATQNRIAYLYNDFARPKARPYTERQIDEAKRAAMQATKVAAQKGDPRLMEEAAKMRAELHMKPPKGTPSDVFQFSKLPPSSQLSVLESAPADEAKKYLRHVRTELKRSPEFMKFRTDILIQSMPQPMQ